MKQQMQQQKKQGVGRRLPGGCTEGTPQLKGCYETLRRASAGRILEARQPPMAPAIRPPVTARPTASAMVVRETGAERAISMVLEADCPPGPPPPGPPPPGPPPMLPPLLPS